MNYRNLHYSFFLASFVLHIVAIIVLALLNASDDLKKSYIVFGAYSKKPTKVFFGTPRGRPCGHGVKRKGSESKTNKGGAVGQKKDTKSVVSKKAGSAKVSGKQGNGGQATHGGKKGKSNHDMRAASKLGKHSEKKCIKTSGFSAVPEREAKNKQKEVERKKKERQEQQLKKEKEQKERELKLEEERRRKEEERRQREEEQKRLEKELEQQQAEEHKVREMEEELEQKEREGAQASEEPEENEQEADEREGDQADDDADDDGDEDGDDEASLQFNLIGPDQANWAVYQKDIQKEVARLWRPPLGVPRGTVCKIKFRVNLDGKVETFELVGRSKMLIYDLSIVRVAKNFKFDKRLWGKEFVIGFRQ
ncbi:MAG: hypothetical protein WCT20_05315 [Candidatus Babeliales bacterium]|jgi:hypothetical protein